MPGSTTLRFHYKDSRYYPEDIDVYIEHTKNFDFAEALISKYDIFIKIFSYLPFNDLYSLSQVNERWTDAIDHYLRKRQEVVIFSLTEQCYKSFDSIRIRPALCLLFQKVGGHLEVGDYICFHGKGKQERRPVIEFVEGELVKNKCPIIAVSCRTIEATFTPESFSYGIVFPFIQDIKTTAFRIPYMDRAKLATIIEEEIGINHDIVCLLMYGITLSASFLNSVTTEIRKRQPGVDFACGGGSIRGGHTFHINKRSKVHRVKDLICAAFCKPKDSNVSFQAYSVIIPENMNRLDLIEPYILRLKENYVRRQHSIAFRATCFSRQYYVKTEMELFKKHFPDVELIGFDGDGEIGVNFYPSDNGQQPRKKKKSLPMYLHFNSTSINLLTWGNIIR